MFVTVQNAWAGFGSVCTKTRLAAFNQYTACSFEVSVAVVRAAGRATQWAALAASAVVAVLWACAVGGVEVVLVKRVKSKDSAFVRTCCMCFSADTSRRWPACTPEIADACCDDLLHLLY
jgi:hypothetical protein